MRASLICAFVLATGCDGYVDGDETTIPPTTTDVSVTVRDGKVPQPGVAVVFQNADDSVIAEAVTDATGIATVEMANGGAVTVVRTYPLEPDRAAEVYTYVGVKAGDRLELGQASGKSMTPQTVRVILPNGTANPVEVRTPCGSIKGDGPVLDLIVYGCGSDTDLYVMDGQGNTLLKHVSLAGYVDLSVDTLSAQLETSFSSTNIPAGYDVRLEKRLAVGSFALFSSGERDVANATNVNIPDVPNSEQLMLARVSRPATEGHPAGSQLFATREQYAPTPSVVDVLAYTPTRYVSEATISPLGLTWVEDGAETVDMVVASARITPKTTGTPVTYHRAIAGPHTGPSLRLPQLPASYAQYNAKRDDQVELSQGVATIAGGYDGIRARLFTRYSILEAVAMSGSATLSYTGPRPPQVEPPPVQPEQ